MTWALARNKIRDRIEAITPTLRASELFRHRKLFPAEGEGLPFRAFTLRHVGGSTNMDSDTAGTSQRHIRDCDIAIDYPPALDSYELDAVIGQDYEDVVGVLVETGDWDEAVTGLVALAFSRDGFQFDIEDINDQGARRLTIRLPVESF